MAQDERERDSGVAIVGLHGPCAILLLLAFLVALSFPSHGFASPPDPPNPHPPVPRDIDIELWHRVLGSEDITGVLINKTVYLQPTEVFGFIKVRCDASSDGEILKGTYNGEQRTYSIDFAKHTIEYQGRVFTLNADDYMLRATGNFLNSEVYHRVFNLECKFDFAGLAVELRSEEMLPAELEAKNAKNREGASGFQGALLPDKTFGLQRSLLSLGTIDWALGGTYASDQRSGDYNFIVGGQVAGGDFDASVSGSNVVQPDWRNTPWQWRTSVQNSSLMSQIIIGRKAQFSNLQLADSMVGFQVTNAPTGYRSSFASYSISDHTEPDWTVELYVNDILVEYKKADPSGFYNFAVPLTYGATDVKLRFLGPYGEVRTKTLDLRIPYEFIPPGKFEYTLSGGTAINSPSLLNSTSTLDLKYGVSTSMTAGGGVRYLHDPVGKTMYLPYVTSSLMVTSGLLLSGAYYHNTGIRTDLSYLTNSGFSVDVQYDHPFTSATTVVDQYSIVDQRRLQLNCPLPFISGFARVGATDIGITRDSAALGINTELYFPVFGKSLSLTADYLYNRTNNFHLTRAGDITGRASLSFNGWSGTMFRPALDLNYSTHRPTGVEMEMSTTLGERSLLNITAGRDFVLGTTVASAALQFTLSAAQLGFGAGGATGSPLYATTTAQGSIGFDPGTSRFYSNNRAEVRRGGIEIVPFYDQNNNGVRDPGEPIVQHFALKQPPGQVVELDNGILQMLDLEPYRAYVLETSTDGLDNITLAPPFHTISVTPPSNGLARIEIPLTTAGQIEGYVMMKKLSGEDPLGGVRFKIRHRGPRGDTTEVKLSEDLLSYTNGEFYYAGITPGSYQIYVDPQQLSTLHYRCTPSQLNIEIKNKEEGDVVEGLNFTIEKLIDAGSAPKPSK